MGGAPTIASSSGAYVAGTAAESLASTNGEFEKGNPHPPSTETGWRLDPMTVDSAWRLDPTPTMAYQGTTCPYLSRGKSTVYTQETPVKPQDMLTQETPGKPQGTPTQETPGKPEDKLPQETIQDTPTVTSPQDELTRAKDGVDKVFQGDGSSGSKDGTSKTDDDIPLGYSPGSPVPSDVTAKSGSKFDATYHKTLGRMLFKRLMEQYEIAKNILHICLYPNRCQLPAVIIDLRIRRYCDAKMKAKVTASPQVLKLYSTEDGRS